VRELRAQSFRGRVEREAIRADHTFGDGQEGSRADPDFVRAREPGEAIQGLDFLSVYNGFLKRAYGKTK
jgi:hypothetical protein